MGKKNKTQGLGKSLIRDRFGKQNRDRAGGDTFLHTSDLNDGYEWGRLNLQSVTEQNNLEDFLTTAELAGTEFTAEKLNIKVIQKDVHGGLPHGEELTRIQSLHSQHKDSVKIPRRPHWDRGMSAAEVDQNERAAFLEWRRSLAMLQEVDGIVLTPYEKNLDFWRQLWRVIERSDVIVQIVDGRNPLLFYCPDLERYVHEVDPNKQCVVLVNKADFLTQKQRDTWAEYFNKKKVRIAFWSAMEETKRQEEVAKQESEYTEDEEKITVDTDIEKDEEMTSDEGDSDIENNDDADGADKDIVTKGVNIKGDADCEDKESVTEGVNINAEAQSDCVTPDKDNQTSDSGVDNCNQNSVKTGTSKIMTDMEEKLNLENDDGFKVNTGHVYTGPELLDFFRSLCPEMKMTTVGMVGYPNVGKSSTINAILKMKKVPVSATPGRTKHFQTLFVDRDLMLCDCPGLVFPSFVTTKADLVISGILPIDQMRDHIPPTSLICRLIPRKHLENVYSILIAKPREGEDPDRVPTAEEFLSAYGAMRGFMNARGMPDCPRSSRYVLKDYVNGKLLYCHPPPGYNLEDFNIFMEESNTNTMEPMSCEIVPESSAIDKEFFEQKFSTSHTRTARSGSKDANNETANEKPWRKHNNKKKREKLRKVYGYLDNH